MKLYVSLRGHCSEENAPSALKEGHFACLQFTGKPPPVVDEEDWIEADVKFTISKTITTTEVIE